MSRGRSSGGRVGVGKTLSKAGHIIDGCSSSLQCFVCNGFCNTINQFCDTEQARWSSLHLLALVTSHFTLIQGGT